jgi:16S rRNA (uracil1498-N3)-methyltransferase
LPNEAREAALPDTAKEPILRDEAKEAARRAAAHVVVADLESPAVGDDDRHHLRSVLRLRPGEAVSTTDGSGGWRLCRYAADRSLEPDGEIVRRPRLSPLITVGFAPVKGDRPEWAVQKLTELGVDRIVILRADLGVVRWDAERAARHLDRLRVVARQAVMQSRQWWLPELIGMEGVDSWAKEPGVAMAVPGGDPPSLSYPSVLVGPEGGWSDAEQESASAQVDLGPGVLRTESAAVAAGVLLVALRAGLVHPAAASDGRLKPPSGTP